MSRAPAAESFDHQMASILRRRQRDATEREMATELATRLTKARDEYLFRLGVAYDPATNRFVTIEMWPA